MTSTPMPTRREDAAGTIPLQPVPQQALEWGTTRTSDST